MYRTLPWKETDLVHSLDTRQTGVDLTVPTNMAAAARVGCGNTRNATSQKG